MKTIIPLSSLAALVFVACARGETDEPTTDDSSIDTAVDAAPDTSARLPPRAGDASGAADASDGGTAVDAADASDAPVMDGPLDASPPVDAAVGGACAAGSTQLGEYATWYGKVNVHRATGGTWLVDDDCSSGADVNTVAYCKKFWPVSATQVQLPAVSPDTKPFTSGGGSAPTCGGVAPAAGQVQFACCAP